MSSVIVKTKEELEKAKNDGVNEITVVGELADHVHGGKRIMITGSLALGGITAAIAAMPFTGGISMAVAGPIAISAGVEIALVLSVIFVGAALLMAIWKDYNEIEYSSGKLILKKK